MIEKTDLLEAANLWLVHIEERRGLARSTAVTYGSALQCFFDLLEHDQIADDDIQAALDQRMGPRASRSTAKRTFDAVHQFWKWWERRGGPPDPLAERTSPRRNEEPRRPLSEIELRQLVLRFQASSKRDIAIVLCLMEACFRIGDCPILKVEDVDFAGERIRARYGKGGKDTWLPMTNWLADGLRAWLLEAGIDGGYVFPGTRGRCSREMIRLAYKRVAGPVLGRPAYKGGTCPHMLRNTLATQLHIIGLDIVELQELMRHARIETTRRYVQVQQRTTRAALHRFDRKLRRLAG